MFMEVNLQVEMKIPLTKHYFKTIAKMCIIFFWSELFFLVHRGQVNRVATKVHFAMVDPVFFYSGNVV